MYLMSDPRPTVAYGASAPNAKEANMKTNPYYSSNPSDPDVYHDHLDCPTGQQIPLYNKVSGTGGNRRCEQCAVKG